MESDSPKEKYVPTPESIGGEGLTALCEMLGFVETEELKAIRSQAVEAAASGDVERLGTLLFEYQHQAEELVSSLQGSEYMRGQIALIIAKASLHRDTGDIGTFLDDVSDAREYAYDAYEDDVVSALEKAPSAEIARILTAIGEGHGFDKETCAEIAHEPYDQALMTAYGYLQQAGLDADEILAAFMKNSGQ